MKTTTQQCFRNDTEFMIWQDNNCSQCKKAVFYNAKLHRQPQYRCAVQKQIEMQQGEAEAVNQRTFDAVQHHRCPFFKSKTGLEDEKILNFSHGESMVKAEESKPEQPKEELVVLGDKVVTKKEADAAEKRMFKTLKKKMKRGEMPPTFDNEKFKQAIQLDAKKMLETFTWHENMMIAFAPLVISHLAWMYVGKVADYCIANKVDEFKKVVRTMKAIKPEYMRLLFIDLDKKHIDCVNSQTDSFFAEYQRDFTILWFQCNAALKKEFYGIEFLDIKTDLLCAYELIELLKRHNKRMDVIIKDKLGWSSTMTNPQMLELQTTIVKAFPKDFKIKDTKQIDLCLEVIDRDIANINFEVVDENKAG